MAKVPPPLSMQDVTKRAIEELGGQSEVLTLLPNRKPGNLYDWTDADRDPEKASRLTYADVRAMTRAGALSFAEDLARLCRRQLVPMDGPSDVSAAAIQKAGACLMGEVGEAMVSLTSALEDGKITASEAEHLTRQVMDVQTVAAQLIEKLAALSPRSGG